MADYRFSTPIDILQQTYLRLDIEQIFAECAKNPLLNKTVCENELFWRDYLRHHYQLRVPFVSKDKELTYRETALAIGNPISRWIHDVIVSQLGVKLKSTTVRELIFDLSEKLTGMITEDLNRPVLNGGGIINIDTISVYIIDITPFPNWVNTSTENDSDIERNIVQEGFDRQLFELFKQFAVIHDLASKDTIFDDVIYSKQLAQMVIDKSGVSSLTQLTPDEIVQIFDQIIEEHDPQSPSSPRSFSSSVPTTLPTLLLLPTTTNILPHLPSLP